MPVPTNTPQQTEQWMEERRKEIENILIEEMCDCNPYGKYQTRQDVAIALLTLLQSQIEAASGIAFREGYNEAIRQMTETNKPHQP